MITHVLLDMDGVLADFTRAANVSHGRDPDEVWESWGHFERWDGMTISDFWQGIDRFGEDFWLRIRPYPWMRELVDLVRSFSPLTVASSPSPNPRCPSGKALWLEEHLGLGPHDYMLGSSKHLMAKHSHVLIDDSEKGVDKFVAHGGKAILFPAPWNRLRHLAVDNGRGQLNHVKRRLEIYTKKKGAV